MAKSNMINENTTFTKTINDYISYKRSLGYNADGSYQEFIIELGNFLSRYPTTTTPVLNFEMVNDYIFQGNGKNKARTIHNRMSMIRQLALFMNMTNPGNYVFPKERFIKIQKDDFIPYIFSHDEIKRLDARFRSLPKHNWAPYKTLVFPMLFRVLYCTGIRLSEALNLLLTDVDLENGILLIRKPKNNRDRLVPMSLSLWEEMRKYHSDMQFCSGYTLFLFPTAKGTNYKRGSIAATFKQVYRDCGIYNRKGVLPRIHDLRHSFCTHALEQMVEQGTDVYCAIPYLCEYVGHRDISSTNAYLRLLPERFSDITRQMQEYCPALIPEVQND
jgi:integrase/recombinase XerD